METVEPEATPMSSVHVLAVDGDLSVRQMIADCLGDNDEVCDRFVDVQVGRLRCKLDPQGAMAPLIRTERGAGCVFEAEAEARVKSSADLKRYVQRTL